MKKQITEEETQTALQELGLSFRAFSLVRHAPTFEEAQQQLDLLKTASKKGYKAAALRLHPDRNPEADTSLFRLVTEVNKQIQELSVRPPPRPVRRLFYSGGRGRVVTVDANGIRVRIRTR